LHCPLGAIEPGPLDGLAVEKVADAVWGFCLLLSARGAGGSLPETEVYEWQCRQHNEVLQVLRLPPQVAVQTVVAPPATPSTCTSSRARIVSFASANFFGCFFMRSP
jgi:hypothetical protein